MWAKVKFKWHNRIHHEKLCVAKWKTQIYEQNVMNSKFQNDFWRQKFTTATYFFNLTFLFTNNNSLAPCYHCVLQTVLSVLYVYMGTIVELIQYTGVVVWAFHGMVGIGLLVLRIKQPQLSRPYKVLLIWCFSAVLSSHYVLLTSWLTECRTVFILCLFNSCCSIWLYIQNSHS